MKIRKWNRIQKTKPLGDRSSWCYYCDRTKVREGQKCPACKHKAKTKHQKV